MQGLINGSCIRLSAPPVKKMSNETCTTLKLKKKLLLVSRNTSRARKFDLLIPGQQKAKIERIWLAGGSSDCCPTAPSPATGLSFQPLSKNPWIVELKKEIHSNQNEKLSVADKNTSKSFHPYHG